MKIGRLFWVGVLSFTFLLSALAQQPAAHPPGDWIKSGVIYEVNPRTFSAAGDFRGVEQHLDYLKVTIP